MDIYNMKNNKLREIEINYHLKLSLSIIRVMGTWPPRDSYRPLYMLYSICVLIAMLGIFIFVQVVNLILIWGNVEKMVSGAFLLMTNSTHTFKIVNILRHQKQIQALLDLVKSETFNRHNVELKHHLTRYTWQGIYHYIAYQSFGLIAVLCWGFTPIADFIAGYKRRLPIDAWYPYNVTKTPAFEITCAHQSVAIIMCCFHDVATDTLVTGLITIACCQLELLKYKIMTIKNDVNDKLLIDCQRLRILKVQKSNDRGYEELRKCIEHNNVIVNFTKEIQEIFGITILVQFLINCIIICLTAFHITQMKVYIPADLIGMISYTCCMIYQIFIYCWHGNELYLQSESVVLAAYSGNWWKYSERYKRAIRLIMLGASRPLTFTAGCLMTLSLHTFVGILRASYSFFTVLQSTTNKNK